jgi:hypothetical protein
LVVAALLVTVLGLFGSCGALLYLGKQRVTGEVERLGVDLQQHERVVADLRNEKHGYVGQWVAEDGSTLTIGADGTIRLLRAPENKLLEGFIVRFDGDHVVARVGIEVTLQVATPPSHNAQVMVFDGRTFHRK